MQNPAAGMFAATDLASISGALDPCNAFFNNDLDNGCG